jgi:hypothetical protein
MTLTFTGSGGVFTREGHILGTLNYVNLGRGSNMTTHLNNIRGDYLTADQILADLVYQQGNAWSLVQNGFLTFLQTTAKNTILAMVADDTNINTDDLGLNMAELIRQMKVNNQTVNQPTVNTNVTYGNGVLTNVGNGKWFSSVTNKYGVQNDYVYNEGITFTCTKDAVTGGATAGNERFSILSNAAETQPLNADWPLGSGATGTYTIVSSGNSQSNTTNLLRDGGFESFVNTNTPSYWPIKSGTANTQIAAGSVFFTGAKSLAYIGDGSTNTGVYQTFNTVGQSTAVPTEETPYRFSGWLATNTNAGLAGVIQISLQDSTNTVIADDNGANNSFTVNVNTLNTLYQNVTGEFRLPRSVTHLPVKIVYETTTPIANAKTVYADEFVLTPETQLYPGGPYFAGTAGNTNWIQGDSVKVNFNNNYGGAFQKGFQRLFNMTALGQQLPSNTNSSISDSLVT